MIRKLVTGEYLKPYGDMTAQEREAYRKRVGEWLCSSGERLLALTDRPMARAQNLLMMSGRWTKENCEAAHEGAVLLTALMAVAETWLPSQLWVKSAWRAVRKLTDELSAIHNAQCTIHNGAGAQGAVGPNTRSTRSTQSYQKTERAVAELAEKGKGTTPGKPTDALRTQEGVREAQGKAQGAEVATPSLQERAGEGLLPVRPKHIDQYVYLLPKATQERAGAVRGLLRELDEAREKMLLLMEDVNAKPDARAAWAKRATKIDSTLKATYKELDAEWEKLVKSGRITVDALGNAYVTEDSQSNQNNLSSQSEQSNPIELTSEQKARRRELRKWLIDLRRGKEGKDREKRIKQWRVNWEEYLTLEPREKALEDEKILEAAKHFGIDLTQILALASVTLAGCRAATN